MAFSISGKRLSMRPKAWAAMGASLTSQAAQSELFQLMHLVRELAIVLNHIDEICRRQKAGKSGIVRIP